MIPKDGSDVQRGSWAWSLRVAEMTAWGTLILFGAIVVMADMPARTERAGLILGGAMALWLVTLFHALLPARRHDVWVGWLSLVVNSAFAFGAFGLMDPYIASAQLIFVPVVVATGLLSPFSQGLFATLVAIGGYWGIGELNDMRPDAIEGTLNSGMFLLLGLVASLLARELRTHFRGEKEEHRLATAVRHRLVAVLDAVDEGVVFRDRLGSVRVVNRRAALLFGADPSEHLGLPVVELLRRIARQTEDPEGFMEVFQELIDDPEKELRFDVEQIIPVRRQMHVYSGPTFDETGLLVGRIEVYTDITDVVQRAAEVERLYEEAHKTAESYQRSLLPDSVPSLPRLNLVANYIPAAGRRAVCGDFYDFIRWPDGRLGLVLGDVCGIGPAAVNDAALTRYMLRSLVSDTADPHDCFERLNSHIYTHAGQDRFVRLLLGVVDPERATLEYVNAGHVPPVVFRTESGQVEWLGEGGIALGVEADSDYKVASIDLLPGDMLVFYTDGVTEAPRHGRPFGQGKFSDLVEKYGVGTPGELAQAIRRSVQSWASSGNLRDDLALLIGQVVPDADIGEMTRELVLPNRSARIAQVRSFVAAFLADARAPVDPSHEVLLAVGEAAANASRHGADPDRRGEIRIQCHFEGPDVIVTVADEGPGFDFAAARTRKPKDRFASGGRGLFLMQTLMDKVEFTSSSEGTVVTMRRRLR